MKIGVIGYGNMGSMIVNNILKLNLLLDDEELIVSNRHLNKFESLIEEYPEENLNITSDNTEVATQCEKILISVETPQFKDVLDEITPFINEKTHIIYTCAGLNFNHIKQFFDGKLSLVIPTLASTVTSNNAISSLSRRKGVTLIKHNKKVELEEKLFIEDIFNEFSYVKRIDDPIYYNEDDVVVPSNDPELEISTIISSSRVGRVNHLADIVSRTVRNLRTFFYHRHSRSLNDFGGFVAASGKKDKRRKGKNKRKLFFHNFLLNKVYSSLWNVRKINSFG